MSCSTPRSAPLRRQKQRRWVPPDTSQAQTPARWAKSRKASGKSHGSSSNLARCLEGEEPRRTGWLAALCKQVWLKATDHPRQKPSPDVAVNTLPQQATNQTSTSASVRRHLNTATATTNSTCRLLLFQSVHLGNQNLSSQASTPDQIQSHADHVVPHCHADIPGCAHDTTLPTYVTAHPQSTGTAVLNALNLPKWSKATSRATVCNTRSSTPNSVAI